MILRFLKQRNLSSESINTGNQLGVTPVMAACASGNVQLLHLLLKHGGALSITDLGNTCMGMACAHGHLGIVQYLLNAGDTFQPAEGALCPHPLMLAMLNDHQDILVYFYLPKSAFLLLPLFIYAFSVYLELVEYPIIPRKNCNNSSPWKNWSLKWISMKLVPNSIISISLA